MIIYIVIGAFVATLLGGLFAIKFKDKLHLILGFSAGAVIGVAFFDLLPEAIDLASASDVHGPGFSISFITSIVALGFIAFMILDRFVILHSHQCEENEAGCENHTHAHSHATHTVLVSTGSQRGRLGASSLSIHSFLDGVAIGLAFQVSAAVGAVVAIAVLVHDFSDGINTVNLILKNGGNKKQAIKWLCLDAVAPVVGVLSTLFFTLPERSLGVILAIFCGFFIYIGASDLLPESHHGHPTFLTTFMTVLGAGVLFVAIHFAGV